MTQAPDLAVLGAGSAGCAAAVAAARQGLRVVLLERSPGLGGTAVRGGVNCWEPVVGGTGLPVELYQWLRTVPHAVGFYTIRRHLCWHHPEAEPYRYPGGENRLDPSRRYADTCLRHGPPGMADEARSREQWHGVVFEPEAMARAWGELLAEAGVTVRLECTVNEVAADGGHVDGVTLAGGDRVAARTWVDATGAAVLARAAGAALMFGQEPRARFGEPSAPETATGRLNGVTLLYRVTPVAEPAVEPLPPGVPDECWWASAFPAVVTNEYPCGDLNLNMLPTMSGAEAAERGLTDATVECHRRVAAHWHHLQTNYAEFRGFRRSWIAPELGVREGPRVLGRYVLTELDLRAGFSGQTHPDLVAVADHAMDTHGADTGRAGCGEVDEPYGVPYRCLLPAGTVNLLVAGRAASFSSLAASSCRLTRTMIQLGQAAGTAAALAARGGLSLADVPPELLRGALRAQRCQVDWPTPPELRASLEAV